MAFAFALPHRAVISVAGLDAEPFLNGLLTNATTNIEHGQRRHAALLTPQGKIIADMLMARGPEGFLLDVDAEAAPMLLKRLTMFRLRARVAIDARTDLAVFAFDGAPDPRSEQAPARSIAPRTRASQGEIAHYHANRIAAGVAEMGADFGPEDVFPADINMDLDGGVDFRKGCFVGQEVVSRMKRRGVARRRTLVVRLPEGAPPTPAPILADGFEVGRLTSVAGQLGLARVRIDHVADAETKGQPFSAGGKALTFNKPDWLAGELAALKDAKG
jgi:folate-binding protein YgfZ